MKRSPSAVSGKALKAFRRRKVMTLGEVAELVHSSIHTARRRLKEWRAHTSYNQNGRYYALCRLYTSGLNARSEFKPRNREVCHFSDSNPNGLRPWWQFFGSIIVAAESCQQGHEFR